MEKKGVTFADSKVPEPSPLMGQQDLAQQKQPIVYKSAEDVVTQSLQVFAEIDQKLKVFTQNDEKITRKDTAKGLKSLLNQICDLLTLQNLGSFNDKLKNYYLTYNATVYLYDICKKLRKSVFSALTVEHLAQAIVSLEGNLFLLSVKYLDWRVKLYVELIKVYQELKSIPSALKTAETCTSRILELKEIEERDPPLPDYMAKMFQINLRIIKIMELKLRVQSGVLKPDEWKKKVEEFIQSEADAKAQVVVESLRIENTQQTDIFNRKEKAPAWKEQLVQQGFDLLKSDIDLISKYLEDKNEKINRTLHFRSLNNIEEEQKNDIIKKNREFDAQMVKEQDFRRASQNVPLEFHVELIAHAYEVQNNQVFESLIKTAQVRTRFRRLEVPYITEIDLICSHHPKPNVPNGFELINVDLNEANLRQELRKYRNSRASKRSNKEEPKKEEKAPTKEDDKKKPAQQQQQSQPAQLQGVQATKEELDAIQHLYVYLIVKRSANPEGAIYDIDVIMGDEETGPQDKLKQGWYVQAVPIKIKQYTGVQETNKTIPYLCIKHTEENLKNEAEKLTLLVDLQPLFGRHPMIRPDLGYNKINIDLRQVPMEFIRTPNMEYVFLTNKNDEQYFINERELCMMTSLYELEKSQFQEKANNLEQERQLKLDITYDLSKLAQVIQVFKSTLDGPLGDQFLQNRRVFLMNFCFNLWKKYLMSPMFQFEFLHELRVTDEITHESFLVYKELMDKALTIFKDGLQVINNVILRDQQVDIIWVCKINLELGKLLELSGEYQQSVQNLRFCVNRIVDFKNRAQSRGVESQKDLFLPFSLTASNFKIGQLLLRMRSSYVQSKNLINKQIRTLKRAAKAAKQCLEADEEKEDEYEYLESNKIYLKDDNQDAPYFLQLSQKSQYSELETILNALHCDMLLNLFRCELKFGRQLEKQQRLKNKMLSQGKQTPQHLSESQILRLSGIPQSQYDGLSDNLKLQTTLMRGETAQRIKGNLNQLQSTLQDAGKLAPPKPLTQQYEKFLLEESGANPYELALLYIVLSSNKQKLPEQRYLLAEAFKYIQKAEEMEKMHMQQAEEDAMFVFSSLVDNSQTQKNWKQFFPFMNLYRKDHVSSTKVPRKPILVSRSCEQITVKLPPFVPLINENINLNQNKALIQNMALFGKISAHGVFVSETCNELQCTGVRQELGSVVTVKNLVKNKKYCFAVGAYDANEQLSNDIGETGEDIVCLHPLPINQISAYLAKQAYQLGDFEVSEQAADHCINYFTEVSDFLDKFWDFAPNPLYFRRLKQPLLKEVSFVELQALTESFVIKARCMRRRVAPQDSEQTKESKNTLISEQRNLLLILNYLLMSAETALCTRNYVQCKRIAIEIYNSIGQFLKMQTQVLYSFHILLKTMILVSEVPQNFWDRNMRILSAKLTYEILRLSFQFHETNLGKRVLYSEIKLFNKKFYTFSDTIMVPEEAAPLKDEKGKPAAAKKEAKKDAKKGGKPEEVVGEQQQVKTVPKLIKTLFESPSSIQNYLETTLMSFPEDLSDYVLKFIENWREQIESFLPYVENTPEQKDSLQAELTAHFDYWETFRDQATGFSKIQNTFKNSPFYLDISCKFVRRLLEQGSEAKGVLDCVQTVKKQLNVDIKPTEAVKLDQAIRTLKFEAIEQDVDWYPNMLPELVKERDTNKTPANDGAIRIFEEFNKIWGQLVPMLQQENRNFSIAKHQRFMFQCLTLSEFFYLEAVVCSLVVVNPQPKESQRNNRYLIQQLDLENFLSQIEEEEKMQRYKAARDEKRVSQLNQIFEALAQACHYAASSKSWVHLQNILRFTLNFLKYEMIHPFVHFGADAWKHLALICFSCLTMLEVTKKEGINPHLEFLDKLSRVVPETLAKSSQQEQIGRVNEQIGRVNEQIGRVNDSMGKANESMGSDRQPADTKRVQFQEPQQLKLEPESLMPVLVQTLTKQFWFTSMEQLDIELLANIIGYAVQSLLVEKRWKVLISITRGFCNITQHYYSHYLLPFQIYAQVILHNEACVATQLKREALVKRTEEYETWNKNNKRRKTRQALLTGEIPQQQIDFERDKAELETQIRLLAEKEEFIEKEKKISEKLISEIKRDANQALEEFKRERTTIENFAHETRSLNEELDLYTGDLITRSNQQLTVRKNSNKMLGSSIIARVKTVIENLAKRQEQFALIQARKDLGSLYFTIGNLSQAEETWNDALDTIFSKIYSLKNWRKVIQECGGVSQIAHNIGVKQILIGNIILSLLSNVCFFKDLHLFRQAVLMTGDLCFSILKITLPHPQILTELSDYRLREVSLTERVFTSLSDPEPAELLLSLLNNSWSLIDLEQPHKALLLVTLAEHISTDIVQSQYYSFQSKLVKSICLALVGLLNESFYYLQKCFQEKDLSLLWIRQSEYLKREKGSNWCYEPQNPFNVASHPYEEKNKEVIDTLLNKMAVPKHFSSKFGHSNVNLFTFAKNVLLYCINKNEIFEMLEYNTLRCGYLRESEKQVRDLLRKLALEEEIEFLQKNIQQMTSLQAATSQQFADQEAQFFGKFQKDYSELCQKNSISEKEPYFVNQEEGLTYPEKRQTRLLFMARSRYLLHKINVSMSLYTRSYYILKYSLVNMLKYCDEQRNCEEGEEKELQILDQIKPQEDKAQGKGAPAKAPPPAQNSKKGAKDEPEVKKDDARNPVADEIQSRFSQASKKGPRRHLNAYWWLKLKTELCLCLFNQNRLVECQIQIDLTLRDSKELKDQYFTRVLTEFQARILIKQGKFDEALEKFEEALGIAKADYHSDESLVKLCCDYAEILFERGHFEEALRLFGQGKQTAEQLLTELSYEPYPQNLNQKAFEEKVQICQEHQLAPEIEEEILKKNDRIPQASQKGGKKDDKKKDDKKGKSGKGQGGKGQEEIKPEAKIIPINKMPEINYNIEDKKLYIPLDVENISCTQVAPNCYIENVSLFIRTAIRYVQCYYEVQPVKADGTVDQNDESILKLLQKAETLKDRSNNFIVPISLRIELFYLIALYSKRRFFSIFSSVQNEYIKRFRDNKHKKDEELKRKIKKYRKLSDKKPFRDLCRNKYIIEVPNFSQLLKTTLIPLLEESLKYFENAILIISRGECLFLEFNRQIEDIFLEMAEVCLLKREYYPRVDYKYIELEDLQKRADLAKQLRDKTSKQEENEKVVDVKSDIESLLKAEKAHNSKMELEALKYIFYSIKITQYKSELTENFITLIQNPIQDLSKIPMDIFYDIIEADYIFKRVNFYSFFETKFSNKFLRQFAIIELLLNPCIKQPHHQTI